MIFQRKEEWLLLTLHGDTEASENCSLLSRHVKRYQLLDLRLLPPDSVNLKHPFITVQLTFCNLYDQYYLCKEYVNKLTVGSVVYTCENKVAEKLSKEPDTFIWTSSRKIFKLEVLFQLFDNNPLSKRLFDNLKKSPSGIKSGFLILEQSLQDLDAQSWIFGPNSPPSAPNLFWHCEGSRVILR